jgi:hypothetical protein
VAVIIDRRKYFLLNITPHTSHITPHTSHLTPHTSHLTPHTPHATRHTPHATRHMPHATRHTPHATRHTSHATRHTPHATRHTPHATRHTSPVLWQVAQIPLCAAPASREEADVRAALFSEHDEKSAGKKPAKRTSAASWSALALKGCKRMRQRGA